MADSARFNKIIDVIFLRASKFLSQGGVNTLATEMIGGAILGLGAALNSRNLGGYMNPNIIDGYAYNPADGNWYRPSIFTSTYDFSDPAPRALAEDLNHQRHWREIHNRVENVGPSSGNAGDRNLISFIELIRAFPRIYERSCELWPTVYKDLGISSSLNDVAEISERIYVSLLNGDMQHEAPSDIILPSYDGWLISSAGGGIQTDAGQINGYGLIANLDHCFPGESEYYIFDKEEARAPNIHGIENNQPSLTEAPSGLEGSETPVEPATPDAASIGRTAQSAISAFNTFLSSVDNWGHMSDLQRVAALTNFYNGISVISGGSIPLPAPLVTGASLLNIATALESGNHASAL
ncbi:hypothetical protein K3217_27580, partial [bacterium BD-1]|nr:hypothetical protein [Ottowia caeni]